nr:hypothetical protein [Tanacetum cinerariifolium]
MIFDGMVKNVNNKVSKFLMYLRKLFTTLRVNSPGFLGRIVPLFDYMLVSQGEGSGTPTESHHTPTSEASQTSLHHLPSSSLLPVPTESLPTVIPSDNPPLKQYTKRTRIAQSSVLPPVTDEPASPLRVATATVSIPTSSGVVSTASPIIPTAALIFTIATESTTYTRRKGKEKMVESDTPKKKKLQGQLDV